MWSNQKSLKVVVPQKIAFCPPYCPNQNCKWHNPTEKNALFHRHGKIKINRFPYVSPRFRCQLCKKVFTSSFFNLSYRDQIKDNYEEIMDLRIRGASKRDIANFLEISLDTVIRRLSKLSRWGLLELAKDLKKIKITESIAYDGIENFSFSQYDPNNINHAIGRESLFIYDFNFCPINRKGRMSECQKLKKQEIEKIHGRYPPRAIENCTKKIFERLLEKSPAYLALHTDNHYLYRSALERITKRKNIAHFITPSIVARNYRNRLFAVNHLDMLTRHRLADFKRETIAFAKTSQSMVESFILLAVHKNYMRPKFVKKHSADPNANKQSPAMHLGLRKKILSFYEFFEQRSTKVQVNLNEDWLSFFERKDAFSRRPIRPYLGS